MAAYTTLAEAKAHLNIETAFTGDDTYITNLIAVAELSIADYCNGGLTDVTPIPVTVKQATLLLIGHLFATRTIVSFAQGYEVPYSFKFLLNPYRTQTIA